MYKKYQIAMDHSIDKKVANSPESYELFWYQLKTFVIWWAELIH